MKRKLHALIGIFVCCVLVTTSVSATIVPTENEDLIIEILDVTIQPIDLDELANTESDENNRTSSDSEPVEKQFTLSYNVNIDGKKSLIEFNSRFVKFSTENAYNGVIIAERVEDTDSDIIVTNCVFLTPEFAQKSFCDVTADYDEVVNALTISVNGKFQTLFKAIPVADIGDLDGGIEIIFEGHPEYLYYISKVRNMPAPDSIQMKEDLSGLSEKSRQDEQLFAIGNQGIAEEEEEEIVLNRALSSTGNTVKSIFDNAGLSWWWTATGFGIQSIPSYQRVVTMNTNLIGSTYYSDCLIWEYALDPNSGATIDNAYIQLKILYNITITYNSSNCSWNDLGANSGATAMRNSSVGIKTTGDGNNDFIKEIEQKGQYNTGGGASPIEGVLKKAFYKVVPYGSYISDAVDVLSSFVKTKGEDYSGGIGHIYYDSDPDVHANQEGGMVRNAILKSGDYSMYFANTNYQQQKIWIEKQPRNAGACGDKRFYYQSHYEILGAYSSGYISLHTGSTSYTRTYS